MLSPPSAFSDMDSFTQKIFDKFENLCYDDPNIQKNIDTIDKLFK